MKNNYYVKRRTLTFVIVRFSLLEKSDLKYNLSDM